jgi:hypothetical protein
MTGEGGDALSMAELETPADSPTMAAIAIFSCIAGAVSITVTQKFPG